MNKRFPVILLFATIGVVVAGVLREHHDSMRQRFDRILEGMSREEAIETLGGPPGDYVTGEVELRLTGQPEKDEWWTNEGLIRLSFDEANKVEHKQFIPNRIRQSTWVERLLRRRLW